MQYYIYTKVLIIIIFVFNAKQFFLNSIDPLRSESHITRSQLLHIVCWLDKYSTNLGNLMSTQMAQKFKHLQHAIYRFDSYEILNVLFKFYRLIKNKPPHLELIKHTKKS